MSVCVCVCPCAWREGPLRFLVITVGGAVRKRGMGVDCWMRKNEDMHAYVVCFYACKTKCVGLGSRMLIYVCGRGVVVVVVMV